MIEPRDIGGVRRLRLGIVGFVIVGAVEKQADMYRLTALGMLGAALFIPTLLESIRLAHLQTIVLPHDLHSAWQTSFLGKSRGRHNFVQRHIYFVHTAGSFT
ncbi:hypothetical protein D9M71_805050 [compost metagenome]